MIWSFDGRNLRDLTNFLLRSPFCDDRVFLRTHVLRFKGSLMLQEACNLLASQPQMPVLNELLAS